MDRIAFRFPVFGRISNDQWNWLCNNIGTPQKDWRLNRGAIWFKDENLRTLYILKWG